MSGKTEPTKVYGNSIVGIWLCPNGHASYFPRQIRSLNLVWVEATPGRLHPQCPHCQSTMVYDEEE